MKDCVRYILPLPYPSVEEIEPNPAIARLLLLDYAGPGGEMTAITQYLFQSTVAEKQGAHSLSELFECISVTEMHHLMLLGKTITALGVDPKYLSFFHGRPQWWSAGSVSYEPDLRRMISVDLAGEKAAIHTYRQHIEQIQAPTVRKILERIVADEEHHVQLLTTAAYSMV